MRLTQWQQDKIQESLDKCQAIIDKAQGKKSRCGCSQEACEKLESYIHTWIMGPLEDILGVSENKKASIADSIETGLKMKTTKGGVFFPD